ncbi:ABC transporter permease [Desulfonema magnum]|uniref:Transport permease protein n=1 Tax=Desulfonema magnum TaxID=45655 RepID=A0A975BFQ6_9BACT|nr:ABC transporter permease [Desulfonema magnum]QTA84473.1 putative ABC transporter, permease protein [Desulfonema magnum]
MIRSFFYFIKLIFQQKNLILSMAKREVATQHIGSFLGFIWTFVHPMIMIFVFWVVFSLGFKVKPTNNVPFVVWLTAGMAPWFVFSDIVNGSAGVIVSNSHLIKRTLFHSQILPFIKIVSCLITHAVFLLVLMGLVIFQGMPFSIHYLQFFYYLAGMSVLALGLGWTVSALNVFIRDVGQIVAVVLQTGFWATPIFWDINMMPPGVQTILKLNPMYYIVQGYRDSFIYFSPFWKNPYDALYFWTVAVIIFVMGALIFKKLKPHFADVL